MAAVMRPNPCFSLGKVVATPGAIEALARLNTPPLTLINRHCRGDWGDVLDADDRMANNQALATGARLFSAYVIQDIKFWVITDAEDDDGQRMATTVLLPEDY